MKYQGVERLGGLKPVKPTSNPVIVLTRAYTLLNDRRRWCKGYETMYAGSKYPIAFCAIGAINRYRVSYDPSSMNFLNKAADGKIVVDINDNPNTKHKRILGLFRKAIKLAKEQQ